MNTTLVNVSELKAHLSDPGWCVLDCRHDLIDVELGRRQYAQGHIPGAQFAGIDDDLSGPKTGTNGRHPLPDRGQLAAKFGAWGIGNDTQVVAYDASGGQFAVRLWWLARWLGHDKVAVLDGGWPLWLAETGLAGTEAATRPPRRFVPGDSLEGVVSAHDLQRLLADRSALLVDARAPERYEGRVEPIDPVAGHIPGAVNRFWQANLADGRFKPAAQLRAEYQQLLAGRSPAQVVAQCGSGVTACHHLLAMHVAGLSGARLYAGSWSEWIADPSRPVAKGPQPG
jgi:thiosulfate/3-mercaptopyruvate sulfurtransferase